MPIRDNFFVIWLRFTHRIDGPLMAIVLLLLAVGAVVLFSAVAPDTGRFIQQMKSIGLALIVMWIVANIPPHRLAQIALPLYLVGVLLLIAVALFGVTVNNSQRWLALGGFRFQPSELLKLAVPLMLAWYFQKVEARINFGNFLIAMLLIALPAWLIKRQPDLGTALLVAASGFYVLYLARLSWKPIFLMVATAVPLIWLFAHDYQKQRVLAFLDPGADPLRSGYHTLQASIAIGSGGLTGKGWMQGTQAHLEFLPERHTDFIFAVYSEEFGLVGNIVLLILYLALLLRAMVIASNAPSLFGRLLAGAITLMLFTYIVVNMGMVSGILPVVGVPLPFISYGGTAMLSLFICVGILMSIQTHRKLVST
ncbi:MAG: rod shape-determining protein RodA [Proteobacteria bacterium]|nr:rod shape-determining protein RodA [Pseudomonadota bacterium]MCL2307535.1 rod shape-determining protein RodA [Pseudomonadota bacterium]